MEGALSFAGGFAMLLALTKISANGADVSEKTAGRPEILFKDSVQQEPVNIDAPSKLAVQAAFMSQNKIKSHQLLNLHKRVRIHDPVDPSKSISVQPRRNRKDKRTIFGTLREDHPLFRQF